MKYKLIAIFLLTILLLILTSCASKQVIEVSPPYKQVNIIYDKNGNLIHQEVYNEETKDVISRDFIYTQNSNGRWVCIESKERYFSKYESASDNSLNLKDIYCTNCFGSLVG